MGKVNYVLYRNCLSISHRKITDKEPVATLSKYRTSRFPARMLKSPVYFISRLSSFRVAWIDYKQMQATDSVASIQACKVTCPLQLTEWAVSP
jgi:hypothetical protein